MLRSTLSFAILSLVLSNRAGGQVLRERDTGALLAQFGASAAVVGDLDADGIADFAIGEPYYSLSSASYEGRVTIYSGSSGLPIRIHVGNKHDTLGASLRGAGDVDGDGTPDVLVGAPWKSASFLLEAGMAVVYSGSTGSVIWSASGFKDFQHLGVSVDSVGDLDGDGRAETIVGSDANYAVVMAPSGLVLHPLIGGLLFGHTVAGIDDVDSDRVPDFLVSESWHDVSSTMPRRGRVWVYSGATATPLFNVVGDADDDYLGRALSRLGDVDGDLIPDFIAASYVSSQGGNQAGLLRVLSGKDGATIHELLGSAPSQWLGFSVSGSTDLDGDGIPEFVAGVPGVPGTGSNGLGQARIHSGADASILHDFVGSTHGTATNVALGMSVASGDFNGDGKPDYVLGDPLFADSAVGTIGGAEIWLGCPASWSNYGSGWQGTLGIPTFTAQSDPGIGTNCSVALGNSLGASTPGLLLLGLAPASISLPSGATLLVAAPIVVPVVVPATGLVFAGDIPDDVALCFLELFLQGVELDPGAVGNLSFSPGLELEIGFDF